VSGFGASAAKSNMLKMAADLTQAAEVGHAIQPQTPPSASGSAHIRYYPDLGKLKFVIVYRHLSGSASMVHFHLGAAGKNGPILVTVCGTDKSAILKTCPKFKTVFLASSWNVPKKYRQALLQKKIYINVHTALNPKGEIRGQVLSKAK